MNIAFKRKFYKRQNKRLASLFHCCQVPRSYGQFVLVLLALHCPADPPPPIPPAASIRVKSKLSFSSITLNMSESRMNLLMTEESAKLKFMQSSTFRKHRASYILSDSEVRAYVLDCII